MKLISCLPVEYPKVNDTQDDSCLHQLRYACKSGTIRTFLSDPAGSVTEIKLVDPADYRHNI